MAKPNTRNGKKKAGIITASDIAKGYTSYGNSMDMWAVQPLQCIALEEKTPDWIRWNANWFEGIALRDLPLKAKRLQKLYNLSAGVIDHRDYSTETDAEFREHLKALNIGQYDPTLSQQFFPIIPNIIQVFLGEQIKRNKSIIVTAIDPESKNEQLDYKMGLVEDILVQHASQMKQEELMKMGIMPSGNTAQQYQQEMEVASQLAEAQTKYQKFRTIAEKWAQNFVDIFGSRNGFTEMELRAFADSLIADEATICLNLREDDFDAEQLRPMKTYVNISPNKRYYSEANFIVNIEFMSISDIINKFRNDLNAEQIEQLENQYISSNNAILFREQNGDSASYYDTSKSYDYNNMVSPGMKEEMSASMLRNFLIGAIKGDNLNDYADNFNTTKLHRVSRVWWPSQRKIGLLTKKDGVSQPIVEQVDENFLTTEKPVYDNSLLKENSAETLITGEHIDWKWVVEWRYVVKIGQNIPVFNLHTSNDDQNIYLYGNPIRFQFKGDTNIYNARPPLEGCRFSDLNTRSVSLTERVRPWQIAYNLLNNMAMSKIPDDFGKKLLIGRSNIKRNSLYQEDGLEPVIEFIDNLKYNPVIDIDDSRAAAADSNGRLLEPRVVELSQIQDILLYLQAGQFVKQQAYDSIGISAQRLSEIGKSESATGIQQAVDGSVNQTEIYFENFCTYFIPRVWMMIIEAGQYYTSLSPSFSDAYLTSDLERSFMEVNSTDLLMRDLFIEPRNTADVRKLMADLKQLTIQDNTMGATFLDKVKTYMAKSPSEILENLQMAEDQRQQQEQSKYQQEQQLQQQQQQFLDQQKQNDQQFQDAELQKKLDSQERIAQDKSNTSIATMPSNDNSQANAINAAKVQQQQSLNDANTSLSSRKQASAEQQQQDNTTLQREKMQVEREKMQAQQNIANQNKSNADLKFIQMQRNKAKK